MARAPQTFRERDLRAAIRAAEAVGKTVLAAEITRDGVIRVIVSRETMAAEGERNPWDKED